MKDEFLRDLYQEVILDHAKNPRNLRPLPNANREARGYNPMCGDTLTVFLKVDEDNIVRDATFIGQGCAISVASASMMTEMLTGRSEAEARDMFQVFHIMCTTTDESDALVVGLQQYKVFDNFSGDLERLRALAGVRHFPARVKCATLAWHTMVAAVNGIDSVSTRQNGGF